MYDDNIPRMNMLQPIARQPSIEHRKIVYNPNGQVAEINSNTYDAPAAQALLVTEIEKERMRQETEQYALQLQYQNQTYHAMYQMKIMELEMQCMQNNRIYFALSQLYDKFQNLLPLQQPVRQIANSSEQSDTYIDSMQIEDAHYEIVREDLQEVIPVNSMQTKRVRVTVGKKSLGRSKMDVGRQSSGGSGVSTVATPNLQHVFEEKAIDITELGCTWNESTEKFDNVPAQILCSHGLFDYPVSIVPEDGKAALGETECEGTVAPTAPGWHTAQYVERLDVSARRLSFEDVEYSEERKTYLTTIKELEHIKMHIFRHKLPEYCIQNAPGSGVPYWEVFDIPFTGNWKEIAAVNAGGLTEGQVAVVRLLHSDQAGFSADYLSMYMKTPSFSRYFNKEFERRFAEGEEKPKVEIRYNMSMLQDPKFAHILSAFVYTFSINGNREFMICETIADYDTDGKQEMILGRYGPKTEIYKEYNLFKGMKSFVYTNMQADRFMVKYDATTKDFVVSKFFKSFYGPRNRQGQRQ